MATVEADHLFFGQIHGEAARPLSYDLFAIVVEWDESRYYTGYISTVGYLGVRI